MMILTLLALLTQDPGKVFVTDGKAEGVFYGTSPLADLYGNYRRSVWTLRGDGTVLFNAPEGSHEDFVKRPMSVAEKTEAGTYSIDGAIIRLTYRDGTAGEGKLEYAADRSIKRLFARGIGFWPARPLEQPLTGFWVNSFQFSGGTVKMTTRGETNYYFYPGGGFLLESLVTTVSTATQTAPYETLRQEVLKVHGPSSKSKMGTYTVKGTGLHLAYDDGTKESKYLGQFGDIKPGETTYLLIGRSLYSGTLGAFPKAGSPPASAGLSRCRNDQFDLEIPAAWRARQEEVNGLQLFLLTPADEPEGGFTLTLTSTALGDLSAKASDPAMVASMDSLVAAWVKKEKVERAGEPEALKVGNAEAMRVRYSLVQENGPVILEAVCAVKDGNALVALTIASEAAMKKHGAAARGLIAGAMLREAPKVELKRAAGEGYELDVPKAWTVKELEQSGTKTLTITPPAGEAEYVVQGIPSEAGAHASPSAPAAIQELRDLLKQLAPAMTPVGDMESFKAAGQEVAGVVYGGRNAEGEVILVKAYLALKAKRAVIFLVVGKESRDREYGAQVRKTLESLTLK